MSAQIIDFPASDMPVEWRIEVDRREPDTVTCAAIPPGRRCGPHWLLWVHATSLDRVPALVEEAQQLLKREQAVKRPAERPGGKRYCERPPPSLAGSPTPKYV